MKLNKRETAKVVEARFLKPVLDLGDLLKKKTKRHKYNARRTVVYGETFDSRAEAARYVELMSGVMNGKVMGLKRQVSYDLPGGIKYVSDFEYSMVTSWGPEVGPKVPMVVNVVEDVKGLDTPVGKLKRKLMKEKGVNVQVVKMDSDVVDTLLKAAGAKNA